MSDTVAIISATAGHYAGVDSGQPLWTDQFREEKLDRRSPGLSASDMRILRTLLGRYAARYHLAGPERDDLIERTFQALASNPDVFFEIPVEKAAAETMHRIYSGHEQ